MRLVKHPNSFRVLLITLVAIGFVIVVSRITRLGNSEAQSNQQEIFYASLQDGVGQEVSIAQSGASQETVQTSVTSLANFINYRSGIALSGVVKTRLTQLEAETLSNSRRRLKTDDLAYILAETALEKAASMTDAEINNAAEVLRGFNAPTLSAAFQNGRDKVKLRASRAGSLSPQEFVAQVQKVRDADDTSKKIFKSAISVALSKEIQSRQDFLSAAMPSKYGNVSDAMTPVQAMLITYSIASDDLLTQSSANLQARMQSIQAGITQMTGQAYPSPNNYKAFGNNGYIFSTPLDMAFTEASLNSLLDKIAQRGAGQ
jgi:hypothetical protein